MDVAETELRSVVTRLHRVEGQIAGIARMIEEGRDCRDVARQLAAAGRALERAGVQYLVSNLTACLRDEEAADAEGYSPDAIQKLFLQLA
jgi:CsoR family transcriptional regulator, copper-sensing transcriptional repressor